MDGNHLLSIKDFSEFTGFAQSTLRYYDEIGLFPPASRGENNYRYYTPFQTITINFIDVLVNLGVPLARIKELAKDRTPESILALLAQQESALDQELYRLQSACSVIHTFRNNIQNGMQAKEDEMVLQYMPEKPIVMGIVNDFKGSRYFYEPFMRFCTDAGNRGVNLNYPVGGYYQSMEAFLQEPSQPSSFFSLDPQGKSQKPAGHYLVGYKRGYYGEMGDTARRFADYAREHSLTFTGPLYIIYLIDEISTADHSQYLSQISALISD